MTSGCLTLYPRGNSSGNKPSIAQLRYLPVERMATFAVTATRSGWESPSLALALLVVTD